MDINRKDYLSFLLTDLIESFPLLKFEKFNNPVLQVIDGYYLYADKHQKMVGIISIDNKFVIRFNTPFEKVRFLVTEPGAKLKIIEMLKTTEIELKKNNGMVEWLLTDHLL